MEKLFRAFILFLTVTGVAHANSVIQTISLENTFDTWSNGPRLANLAAFDTSLGQLQSVSFNTVLNLSAYLDITNDSNAPYVLGPGGGRVNVVTWQTWPLTSLPLLDVVGLIVTFDVQSIDAMSSVHLDLSPVTTTSSYVLSSNDVPEWVEIVFDADSSQQGLQYWNDGTQPGPVGIVHSNLVFTTSGAITVTYNYISAVPEPETYAMLLAGLGLMGVVVRRRKAKQA
jgi:hypothetical protein